MNGFTRQLERVVAGIETQDGAGVRLRRVLTQDLQRRLDPFLMLDAFHSDNPDDYIAGFPDHPHRGFETVTYMVEGRLRHRDSTGNEGVLQAGGVQWMTAGRGLIHSEIPEQQEGLMSGFQLWLNLPAKDKMTTPGYVDLPDDIIPRAPLGKGSAKLIAGQLSGVEGAKQRDVTEPLIADVTLPQGESVDLPLPAGHNAFIYLMKGTLLVGQDERKLPVRHMGILSNTAGAEGVRLHASEDVRFFLVAGKPLNEPIAQWGPFVMNTHAQLEEAVMDFREGRFA